MRVKFVQEGWGQVDLRCNSAYVTFGFLCIAREGNKLVVPEHLIKSSILITDSSEEESVEVQKEAEGTSEV